MYDYKILSIDTIAGLLTITIKGNGSGLKNNVDIVDNNGNLFRINTVAMTNPFSLNETILNVSVICQEKEFGNKLKLFNSGI